MSIFIVEVLLIGNTNTNTNANNRITTIPSIESFTAITVITAFSPLSESAAIIIKLEAWSVVLPTHIWIVLKIIFFSISFEKVDVQSTHTILKLPDLGTEHTHNI